MAALLALIGVHYLRGKWLLIQTRSRLGQRGIRCLVVYSDSPKWSDYIERHWLPRLGRAAVALNWSERAAWPRSLEARLFRQFVASDDNFNPAVLFLRGLREPRVYRFYHAFRQAGSGRGEYLEQLERALFDELAL